MSSLRRDLTRDLLFNMADEGERSRLVAEFAGVTDVDTERAQFYLESSGWNLNVSNMAYVWNLLKRSYYNCKLNKLLI